MAVLPYSRVVDITLTRQDSFATAAGFSVIMIVQTVAIAGKVDATVRSRTYSSMTEVAVDFNASTEAYKAANAAFSQNPRPRQIKIAYRNTASAIASELDAIHAYDPNYYWICFTAEIRDTADQRAAADWAQSNTVLMGLETADVDTENSTTLPAASLAEYLESVSYDRAFAFYHPIAGEYPVPALFGYCATRDLDQGNLVAAQRGSLNSGNAYTAKFKRLVGISALDKSSAVVQAATGFIPGLGIDKAQGHSANVYVNIGGLDMVVEGNVASGAFIDEIHAGDWIVARTREALLSALANNPRVPFTNPGVGVLTNAVDGVMRRAFAAGIIAADVNEEGGVSPEYAIRVDRVENLSASQRRNRIAPTIQVDFRYAGAMHYASANFIMRF